MDLLFNRALALKELGRLADAAADVTQARQLIRESFETKTYNPQTPEIWEAAAEKFAEI